MFSSYEKEQLYIGMGNLLLGGYQAGTRLMYYVNYITENNETLDEKAYSDFDSIIVTRTNYEGGSISNK